MTFRDSAAGEYVRASEASARRFLAGESLGDESLRACMEREMKGRVV